jgi:arylsulfatase
MNDEGLKLILEDAADNLFNEDPYCQQGGGEGVIIAQGGKFAGWSLYMKDGQLTYMHNGFGNPFIYAYH